MSPLLSIAIPTFNRSERIKILHANFLSKVGANFESVVEIIVCDNSDYEQSENNRELLTNSNVSYKKNKINLGFSGNVIRCLQEARGEFVWIISDDDKVDYNAFCQFIEWLKDTDLNCFNAIMLPFYNYNENDGKCLMNTEKDWGRDRGALIEIIRETNSIPFVLFSGVIVRNPKENKDTLLQDVMSAFEGNDYIQVPLFMRIIGRKGNVLFYHEPLQEYQASYNIRFSLMRMVESMEGVISFIADFYGGSEKFISKIYDHCHYKRWMYWMLLQRVGICQIKGADEARWVLLWKWKYRHFTSLHNLGVASFCLLPKPWAKFLYRLRNL